MKKWWEKRANRMVFSSACLVMHHGQITSQRRTLARGRCQSAAAARVGYWWGTRRAGMHSFRGIDIPRTQAMVFF
jgi:hypothetical protein